VSVVTARP